MNNSERIVLYLRKISKLIEENKTKIKNYDDFLNNLAFIENNIKKAFTYRDSIFEIELNDKLKEPLNSIYSISIFSEMYSQLNLINIFKLQINVNRF